MIPPSSVKITSDGNLAGKLEALSGQAEAKIKKMEQEREILQQRQRQDEENKTPEKR